MQKIISFLFVIFSFVSATFASYEENYPLKIDQPDGSTIQCYITGDEFHHRVHDENGYTIIRDPQTGYLVYAILKNDELVSSGYFVGQTDPQSVGLRKGVDISITKREQKRRTFFELTPERKILPGYENNKSTRSGWNNGTLNNIVIYIRFDDQDEFESDPVLYEDKFNKDEENYSSMYRYFKDISHGQTLISSSFYPIRTENTIVSYKDIHPRAYYMPYNSVTNPEGYSSSYWDRAEREHSLLKRALESIADQIPEDLNLDFNNDGYVDNVCFIVRGNTTAWSSLLWPHKWSLYSEDVMLHGKLVSTYNFQIENHLDYNTTSVLTHEMFHSLGAPDLYRYTEGGGTPVGQWDLMASNTNPPQATSVYMQYKYGGWIEEIPTITQSGNYTLDNVWSENNKCYKILSPNTQNEFFIVEYRDRSVFWDRNIPGSGLLIYRINPYEEGNAYGPPDEVYIYRPSYSLGSANFSNNVRRTTFSAQSDPPCVMSNNIPGGIMIANITETESGVSFDVLIGPTIIGDKNNIDFEEVSILEPLSKTLIVNSLNITNGISYSLSGEDADYFTISENEWDILEGGSLNISFAPSELRNYNARLTLSSPGSEPYRVNLTGEGIIVPVETDFTSSNTHILTGAKIFFYDKTIGTPSSWTWNFEGGEPSVSNDQNPVVTYNEPGNYTVSLHSSNHLGNDEIIKTLYITVDEKREGNIICNDSFELWNDDVPNCWNGTKTDLKSSRITEYTENPYDGNISCVLSNSTSYKSTFSTKPVSVIAGKNYNIEFYVKGGGKISTALYDRRPENRGFSPDKEFISVDSEQWTKHIQSVVATQNTDLAEFVFFIKNTIPSGGNIIIDKVTIAEGEPYQVNTENFNISVYPNPSDGNFIINTDIEVQVEIFSITGRLILQQKNLGSGIINLENNPKGIYLLRTTDNKGIIRTDRLIVQ